MPKKRSDELHEGRAAGYRRTGAAVRRIAAGNGVTPGTVLCSLTLVGTPERRGDRGDSPGSRTGDYPSTRDTLRPDFDDRAKRSRGTEPLPSRALGGSTHERPPQRARQRATAYPRNAISQRPRPTALAYLPISEPRGVCRHEAQLRFRRFVSRTKMRAAADHRRGEIDAMNRCEHHLLCHHYVRLHPSRTADATGPLSASMPLQIQISYYRNATPFHTHVPRLVLCTYFDSLRSFPLSSRRLDSVTLNLNNVATN